MTKQTIIFLSLLCCSARPGTAQIAFSGQTAAQYFQSAPTRSPRAVNAGRPSFGWETELFIDAQVTENVFAFSTIRASEARQIEFDQIAIRLMDLTPLHLNIQAGKFDLPFGNLGERRYPRRNNLFSLPLIYEYRSALPSSESSQANLLSNRGRGTGMRLLDLGMYGLGAMVYGSEGILDYAFSISNGTVSTASYQSPNSVDGLGKVIRLALTPMTGLTIGSAYAWGPYLVEYGQSSAYGPLNAYVQKSAEVDIEISRGHFAFYGEGVYTIWPFPLEPRDQDFKVFGYYCEAKYTLIPRLYVALRVSGLRFGNAVLGSVDQPWDDNATEWEGGLGYFIDRNVLLKLVRRETRIQGGTFPKDNLTVLQLAVSY
jgi:hypothetical protein